MGRLVIYAIPIAFVVYAFIDVLSTPAHATKRGPKWLWALAVLVLPIVGALLWFLFGRPWRQRTTLRSSAPDDDPDFLRRLDQDLHRPDGEVPDSSS